MSDEVHQGKVAVITGGGRGFGKAFGTALAARGAHVVLADIDGAAAEAAAAEIMGSAEITANGGRVYGAACDVADEAAVAAVFGEVAERHGGIDVLVNNAGLHSAAYNKPSAEIGIAGLRRLFDVNVIGVYICSLAARPAMSGRPGAAIVNISSSAAYANRAAYGVSKLAVRGATAQLAREFAADGIRVNAIAPGLIFTDTIRAELPRDEVARVMGQQILPREGEERDIVDALLFLVSPAASFVTGETLRVTGGFALSVLFTSVKRKEQLMRDAVIVDAVRAPIGRRKGTLREVHPVDLSASVLTELAARNRLDPELIEDIVWGCVTQIAEQSTNVGRLAVLAAGWPEAIPGVTLDRACGSSQQAVHFAAASVIAGHYDIVVAGGVESMSRVPLGSARAVGEPFGPRVKKRYQRDSFSQGLGAEDIARRWGFSRTQLDEFALESHQKAAAATDGGAFAGQLVPVSGPDGELTADEGIRRDSSLEKLASLKPAFRDDGVIHAGNSSQISDGCAALLITTSERAAELGLRPLARFHSGAVTGDDPVTMLTAPIPATAKVLKRAGLTIGDIGVFEVNEAFASVPLAWEAETGADHARLNPLGGAIAVGHPLGASGAILMTRMVHHMRDHGIRYGLQTMCEAGGMANATVIELLTS